ncbi:hypothetical protein SAY87_022897 [Trapa incisa]|uniref:Uncharacterized protein n=1 Tax=Trapa incisa TaxID=236973 RepID=A0AAN7Q4W7_9MYRT|nr:hypothetical protein SAY87_022897 [Trapa incisa]
MAEGEPCGDAASVVRVAAGHPPPALPGAPETLHAHRAVAGAVVGVNRREIHDHRMPVWLRRRTFYGGVVVGGVAHRKGEGLVQVEGEAGEGFVLFGKDWKVSIHGKWGLGMDETSAPTSTGTGKGLACDREGMEKVK